MNLLVHSSLNIDVTKILRIEFYCENLMWRAIDYYGSDWNYVHGSDENTFISCQQKYTEYPNTEYFDEIFRFFQCLLFIRNC